MRTSAPSSVSTYERWYGRDTAPRQLRPLSAGPLRAVLDGLDVRWVHFGDHEVLRGICVSVRNEHWKNVPALTSDVTLESGTSDFLVKLAARHQDATLDFSWEGEVAGSSDGVIRYSVRGLAESDFRYGRIGLCLLHGSREHAGRPYRGHTAGGWVSGRLPKTIGVLAFADGVYWPLFPAVDELRLSLQDGVHVRLQFEGDVFEMEDQRNWSDASFKTYCTPIADAKPRQAKSGQVFHQQATLRVDGPEQPRSARQRSGARAEVVLDTGQRQVLPAVGIGLSSLGRELSDAQRHLIRALAPGHLHTDVVCGDAGWRERLEVALRDARALGCPLELAAFFSASPGRAAEDLLAALPTDAPVARLLVFDRETQTTTPAVVSAMRAALVGQERQATIGAGTNLSFYELNSNRSVIEGADVAAYSITPQQHTFDEESMVETLCGQADTVVTARTFVGERPIAIGRVTLRPPSAPGSGMADLRASMDPRQTSLFAAGWTVGSLAALASAGATSVTYYEAAGPLGVLGEAATVGVPPVFSAFHGRVYPVYHVLAAVSAGRRHDSVHPALSNQPARVAALAVSSTERLRVLLANLVSQRVVVRVSGAPPSAARLAVIDDRNALAAGRRPSWFRSFAADQIDLRNEAITLPPYAIGCIDFRVPLRRGASEETHQVSRAAGADDALTRDAWPAAMTVTRGPLEPTIRDS